MKPSALRKARRAALARLVLPAVASVGLASGSGAAIAACGGSRSAGSTAATQGSSAGGRPGGGAGAPVTIIREEDLRLGPLGAVAVAPELQRAYVGRKASRDKRRRDLLVLTLGADGAPAGEPRRYPTSLEPLAPGTWESVEAILVDAQRRKLYLALELSEPRAVAEPRVLVVQDLDEKGEPVGAPRGYAHGGPYHKLAALARHPTRDVLYAVGWGAPHLYAIELDAAGEPRGRGVAHPVGTQGKLSLALDDQGRHAYLGTYPDTLEVVPLDARGMPEARAARTIVAGSEPSYLRVAWEPGGLLVARVKGSARWPLGPDGLPVGSLQASFEVSFPLALTLRARGARPTPALGTVTAALSGDELKRLGLRAQDQVLAVAPAGGSAPVALVRRDPSVPRPAPDDRLRVTLLDVRASGKNDAAEGWPARVIVNPKPVLSGARLRPGEPSAWTPAGVELGEPGVAQLVSLAVPGASWVRAQLEIDRDGPTGAPSLAPVVAESAGSQVAWVVRTARRSEAAAPPSFAAEGALRRPNGPGVLEVTPLTQHAARYREVAASVAVPPADRARRFPLGAYHLLGGQGNEAQLEAEAQALALLGFNTVAFRGWEPLAPRRVSETLARLGLPRRTAAIYSPPSYFDFELRTKGAAAFESMGRDLVSDLRGETSLASVDHVMIGDEPGWYYPAAVLDLRKREDGLAALREYLREAKTTPRDFGARSWSEVVPIVVTEAKDLPKRRLFYWTVRFFAESAARGMAQARVVVDRLFGRRVPAGVNFNNFVNRVYMPSPGKRIGNNAVTDGSAAMGGPDWFLTARRRGATPWTEDWFADQAAQTWSFYGDVLRSTAALAGEDFGGYVVGGVLGEHAEGASYKLLSLIGHGAKYVDVYAFGPEPLFPGNCWSENFGGYGSLARALRLVGRSERVLHPGRPSRGRVALFLGSASGLWDGAADARLHTGEPSRLHHALVHDGYTVDVVDDEDVEAGELARRGYTTLYVAAPNVSARAQGRMVEWARSGGVVAVLPGAAVADEYDTPTDTLDTLLGVGRREAQRPGQPMFDGNPKLTAVVSIDDATMGPQRLDLRGFLAPLAPTTARVVARFEDGRAAMTVQKSGRGTAIAYGFFPGWEYWLTPDRSDPRRLPLEWSAAARAVATAPARVAGTERPVRVDRPGVEALRLESAAGVAVVLLNWTDEPIDALEVVVPKTASLRVVSSAAGSPVSVSPEGDGSRVRLPLSHVDVLSFEPRPPS